MNDRPSVLPEDVEVMTPGLELAAMLDSVDRRALSGGDRLRLAQARDRLVSHLQAQLLADLHAVTFEEPPGDGVAEPQQASRYPWAETEVAFAMRWTRVAAGGRLEQARELIEDLPAVQRALLAGDIDMPRALVISELVRWLPCDDLVLRRAVVDKVIDKVSQWTTGQLRARLRKLLLAIDPALVRRRYVTAVKTRRVEHFGNPEGTGELWGRQLPPQDVAAAWERLTAIARAAKAAGDGRGLDQLRADAFLDLLIGQGIAVGEPVTRHTGLSVATDSHEGEVLSAPRGCDGEVSSTRHACDGGSAPAVRDEPAICPVERGVGAPDRGADRRPDIVEDTAVRRDETLDEGARDPGVPASRVAEGGDPAWPAEPSERIGPHDIYPDPTAAPIDSIDVAGQRFDGSEQWPSDWPGSWIDDPAVVSAGGGRSPLMAPADPAHSSHSVESVRSARSVDVTPVASPGRRESHSAQSGSVACERCGRLPGMPVASQAGPLPGPRRGVVELQVPLTTAIGLDDLPGELNGYGPVLGEVARQIIAAMPDAQWRFSAYDRLPELAVHGILTRRPVSTLDRDGDRRRPTAEQAAFVRTRDRTCRAPGCRRPARVCDLDHTEPWVKGGKTLTCNLGCLCRAHHLFRHTTGCDLTQLSPGVFVWQTPRGLQYLTRQESPMLALSP